MSPFLRRRISSRFLTGLDGQTEQGGEGEADDNLGVEPEMQNQGGILKGPLKKLASYLPEGSYWSGGHGKRTRRGKK